MIVAVFACAFAVALLTCIVVGGRRAGDWLADNYVPLAGCYDHQQAAIPASQPACTHAGAVPVDTLAGERVAWLCPDCDLQLPVS